LGGVFPAFPTLLVIALDQNRVMSFFCSVFFFSDLERQKGPFPLRFFDARSFFHPSFPLYRFGSSGSLTISRFPSSVRGFRPCSVRNSQRLNWDHSCAPLLLSKRFPSTFSQPLLGLEIAALFFCFFVFDHGNLPRRFSSFYITRLFSRPPSTLIQALSDQQTRFFSVCHLPEFLSVPSPTRNDS